MVIAKLLLRLTILNINEKITLGIMNTLKKVAWFVCLLGSCVPAWAASTDSVMLKARLEKLSNFSGAFLQQVKNQDGQIVQKGRGQLLLKKPYYFNWKMEDPDRISIVSDGKTVWMYTPELEQVTAMNLSDLVDNRVLLLLTSNNTKVWQSYQVQKQGDHFTLVPVNKQGQHFEISIDSHGKLSSFAIIEEDGQRSFYQFSHQKMGVLARRLFVFHVPKGVTVDDQR